MTPHTVHDPGEHGLPADLIAEANREWPPPEWAGWFTYPDGDGSAGKRVCPRRSVMPSACWRLLGLAALESPADSLGLNDCVPDLSLWGGGLHDLGLGCRLDRHLDADRHPQFGLRRVASSVLFVGDAWEPEWGGQLELWSPDGAQVVRRIDPVPGRLVHFAASDTSWHSVAEVRCPQPLTRRSLALFWYGRPPQTPGKRPRALFADPPPLPPARWVG